MVDTRQSKPFAVSALLAAVLSSCGLLGRRDGLFECDYSKYGNPPVVYRYYYDSKILSEINQGEHVINKKYSVEEVDGKVLWRVGDYISYSLDKETMYLKQTLQGSIISSLNGTSRAKCKWK